MISTMCIPLEKYMISIYVVNLTLYDHIWAQQEQSTVDSRRIFIFFISGIRIRDNKCLNSFIFNKWQSHLKPLGFDLETLYIAPMPN